MSQTAEKQEKPTSNVIPVQLSAPEFEQFSLPRLSLPQQGPAGKIGDHKAFNDSKAKRRPVFNAGLKPNLVENPRNRQSSKRGRPRFFDAALYAVRFTIERIFVWEDKLKRLLLRFETQQQRHRGFKLIAFTLSNLREFCER